MVFTKKSQAFDRVSKILQKHIVGFQSLNHFRFSTRKRLQLRFQYNWAADDTVNRSFIGVGYIFVDELLNGFDKKENE